ncbi:YiiD C-terminal domain-containing protein [Nocardia farcinica]|uniref:YiiD C-terminal domain-containing protein n=1 Tax=Nocardia TaxID=1817 RepID=UPI000BF14C7A|nr:MULTISPECIES: YiiD C-terminal domain-containing protein [Nocardia]MBF6183938.1 YiiD C-terminal domain-containing protein [Nocardia farcinica]MBF6260547.1 YiiD C-terminal domain-containing protein [Nocardia farcinica]MBF6270503.1 YiiD C-terminal domain-containing protein [Nocardia farcinica]MBF6279783.1 YiiD C-terminal domain-containing protein [Nocardia farcinica]MBF6292881.1 YiiD C-terminal domain-containing protein [Nocardia farcinica]
MTTGERTGFAAGFPGLDTAAVDYDYLCTASRALIPFGNHVGTLITEIGPGRATVEIPAGGPVTNHMGTVHAGALFTAADIAGAAAFVGAAATGLTAVKRLVLRGASAAYKKPAAGRIRAIATVTPDSVAGVLASPGGERFEIAVPVALFDDADVLVAEFGFDYVCDTQPGQDAR